MLITDIPWRRLESNYQSDVRCICTTPLFEKHHTICSKGSLNTFKKTPKVGDCVTWICHQELRSCFKSFSTIPGLRKSDDWNWCTAFLSTDLFSAPALQVWWQRFRVRSANETERTGEPFPWTHPRPRWLSHHRCSRVFSRIKLCEFSVNIHGK